MHKDSHVSFEKMFCKRCHHSCDVIAGEQFVTSNWIFKKCPFLCYVKKDIFGGQLAGSFDVEPDSMSKRKENIFEDVLDFDIKTLFEQSVRSDPCVRGNYCMRLINISKFIVVIRRSKH